MKVRVSLAGDVTSDLDYAYGHHWFTPTHQACSLKAVWALASCTISHTANKVTVFWNKFKELMSTFYPERRLLLFSLFCQCGCEREQQPPARIRESSLWMAVVLLHLHWVALNSTQGEKKANQLTVTRVLSTSLLHTGESDGRREVSEFLNFHFNTIRLMDIHACTKPQHFRRTGF